MTSHQLLRLKQVEEKTGLKRSQIYLYMKGGSFPRSTVSYTHLTLPTILRV